MPTPLYHLNGTEGEPATRWNPKDPLNGVTYPPNIGDVWPDADLTAIGLGKAADPDAIPDGKRSTGKVVRTVSGVPKWVHTLEDTPVADVRLAVNAERDRRVDLGLTVDIGGTDYTFQFDAKSRENISGAATLAGFAVAGGALAGNYLWHGGTQPFSWILADNSVIQIDAPTMFAVGQAAANRVSLFTFAARTIKELNPIPLNYTADSHWP